MKYFQECEYVDKILDEIGVSSHYEKFIKYRATVIRHLRGVKVEFTEKLEYENNIIKWELKTND